MADDAIRRCRIGHFLHDFLNIAASLTLVLIDRHAALSLKNSPCSAVKAEHISMLFEAAGVNCQGLARRLTRRGKGRIDALFQLHPGFPKRQALGRNGDFLAGLGIAAFVGLVFTDGESAKATDLHAVPRAQGIADGIEK